MDEVTVPHKHRSTYYYIIAAVTSALILFGLFLGVNPASKPLVLVFVPVILSWVFVFSCIQLLIKTFLKPKPILTALNGTGTTAVILLMLMSGINQLSVTDILLVFAFAFVSGFYLYRTWS